MHAVRLPCIVCLVRLVLIAHAVLPQRGHTRTLTKYANDYSTHGLATLPA